MTVLAVARNKHRSEKNGVDGKGRQVVAPAYAAELSIDSGDPAWFEKARTIVTSSGYIERLLRVGKTVVRRMEHIIVWEMVNGKKVPKGWVVHHVNERKDDNDPSNLVALPPRLHRELHVRLRELSNECNGLLHAVRRLELTQEHVVRATRLDELRKYWFGE
ncbi:HNH endonuclease signature motif containing protein [Geomonas agri]|uniref:HNH endonuclease signature motif containing protein n=1 Tax=Geomonas agri TaxID=2873702 RepID=UPI001CD1E06A|nr:HNH endonuclease signature motif containing protein [Geomonas agri]